MAQGNKERRVLTALKVKQWLKEWNSVKFDKKDNRAEPEKYFHVFSISAKDLKALSGINRRSLTPGMLRADETGVQRRHDVKRSSKIFDYLKLGYPLSGDQKEGRDKKTLDRLRKPGWLPTAIVVNILQKGDERFQRKVDDKDLIEVKKIDENISKLILPENFTGSNWKPKDLSPIEVIDGQHRLWAFDNGEIDGDFEFPVIAFHGLDISWQAYLFWTINITPKRINPSLAFDLHPLLRTEDWLEEFDGHSIYRESRAQELTESLWANPQSPWFQRINMLGEPLKGDQMVSQAAWVRALASTYVKHWEGRGISIGGLYGAPAGEVKLVLPWSRAQQAAFLIVFGNKCLKAIEDSKEKWALDLRKIGNKNSNLGKRDLAFYGVYTLLNSDQGIRAILNVGNDLCFIKAKDLKLQKWVLENEAPATDETAVNEAILNLEKQKTIIEFIEKIAISISQFDWRTSSTPDLTQKESTYKAAFRGSGGYKELRRALLAGIAEQGGETGKAAAKVFDLLGYKK